MSKIRLFIFASLAMFIMVSLQHLGISSPINPMKFISPLAQHPESKQSEIQREVRMKLQQRQNTFHLTSTAKPFIKDAQASEGYDNAKAYAVIDLDNGNIINSKASNQQFPIASLTKVMTAVVALDLAKPSDIFTISKADTQVIPTKIGVVSGERLTLEELLHGALLVSGNDAAEAIKNGINKQYNSTVFVQAMNEKAKMLGLQNTHFANPQGFDNAGNYSSAEDLAILTHYALQDYPLIAQIAKKDYMYYPANERHKQFDMYNWNSLIGVYPGAEGLKIGNTDSAGSTMIATAKRGDKHLAVILLGAPDIVHRDLWTAQLLDQGFSQTDGLQAVNITKDQLEAKYKTWKFWN